MKHAQFVISEFTNPSGEIVFRVSGWPDGKRVRRNQTHPATDVRRWHVRAGWRIRLQVQNHERLLPVSSTTSSWKITQNGGRHRGFPPAGRFTFRVGRY
jgi:hypothetical protein